MMSEQTKYIDGSNLSEVAICELFENEYKSVFQLGETRQDYNCGVTNASRQNIWNNGTPILLCVRCSDADTASTIKEMLEEYGFDIESPKHIGNEGTADCRFIYMCHKKL